METEEQAEFILGVLEREQKKAEKKYAEMQLTWADPICWPNHEELLDHIHTAVMELEEGDGQEVG